MNSNGEIETNQNTLKSSEYTIGTVNPYRSLVYAMIDRGETVPRELYIQALKFDYYGKAEYERLESVRQEADRKKDARREHDSTLSVVLFAIWFAFCILLWVNLPTIKRVKAEEQVLKDLKRWELTIPEEHYSETFEDLVNIYIGDEGKPVELINSDGEVHKYMVKNYYVGNSKHKIIGEYTDDGKVILLEVDYGKKVVAKG